MAIPMDIANYISFNKKQFIIYKIINIACGE